MRIEIDLDSLTEDERYHLTMGLEAIKKPNASTKKVLAELRRISTKEWNEFCHKHPYDWV